MSRTKRLVIDASIARAAGLTEHPTSKRCRVFLETVMEVRHRLVLTPPIREEWRNHQSRFSRTWRVQMESRNLVERTDVADYQRLKGKVEKAISEKPIWKIVEKDWLLIEAALETDKTICSKDDKVRHHYQTVAQQVGQLRRIVWANPNQPDEGTSEWLRDGAKPDNHRQLGYARQT